jgi:Small protein found in certain Dnd DNA modification systems
MKAPPCFDDPESKKIIRRICEQQRVDIDLLKDLCEIVNNHAGSGRRFGLPEDIETVLDRFIKSGKAS